MKCKDAKNIACEWVTSEAKQLPRFAGAFFHGSVNSFPDDAIIPTTSDLDIMVVVDGPVPSMKLGKFIYRQVLLEVSYVSMDELRSPETVLGRYNLAGSFRTPGIISDPSGWLTQLQRMVSRNFARRKWVIRRCAQARDKVLSGKIGLTDPLHDQVMAWAFTTGITTHVLLVAGLCNPTVRTRYVAVRKLLAEYDCLEFHETLLQLLGCNNMTSSRVEYHLEAMTRVFDAAKVAAHTPFFFSTDITDIARPIAVDGSWELIRQGYHREAVFWIVVTYCRCLKILSRVAPAKLKQYIDGLKELIADLGINCVSDLRRRTEETKNALGEVWEVAETILKANSEIEN